MKKIFVFKATNMHNLYGYTKTQDGIRLPNNVNGKDINWEYFQTLQIQKNEPPRVGLDTEEMLEAIDNKGFYINIIKIDCKIS